MPRSYVNNASNRSLGRVGMPVGSMVVSRGSSGGGSSFGGGRSSGVSMPKTYVDNAYNRDHGRVGMPHGSMTVSKGDSGIYSPQASTSSTYVDNSYNRNLGRVGMAHGAMVVSKGDCGTYSPHASTSSTYVDNSYNRNLGRVGMPHGDMVVSKGDSGKHSTQASASSPYVDNSYNRNLGRVGMPHGSMVVSKGAASYDRNSTSQNKSGSSTAQKVYKDNTFNRRLGRVGKPLGTAVYSTKSSKTSGIATQTYVDNWRNRSLGRVGKPLGSIPVSRISKQSREVRDIFHRMEDDTYDDYDYNKQGYGPNAAAEEAAMSLLNRKLEEMTWAEETGQHRPPKTTRSIISDYSGQKIIFCEIKLGKKIGSGGFGDVHFAKWKGAVVAVKKLRVQRVSKQRLKDFTEEVLNFCDLDHPNIVKFIGACVVTPNLCIVMEYMQTSLFDALHMNEEIDLSDEERLQIIKQTCDGLEYLHKKQIAHCDLKSQNILLDYEPGKVCVAKITDFGLSIIKTNTETSTSGFDERVSNVGTPRYSAPEVLRGESLSLKDMLKADVYSFSLVMFEIIYGDEPFYSLSYAQLRKQVGENGIKPDIPNDVAVEYELKGLMERCWDFNASHRPSVQDVQKVLMEQNSIYVHVS